MKKMTDKNELLLFIRAFSEKRDHTVVALDGRCASGKTSLARFLAEELGANVVSADDFFLQAFQRTEDRLSEPGGNFDRERFKSEVILPLSEKKSFSYRPFDCCRMDFGESIKVEKKALTFIEGSYCCRPGLSESYDLKIFVTADEETRTRRIIKRNGAYAVNFFERWIPLEERYFSAFSVMQKADIVFDTSGK